jgi:hypothetical protein
MLCLSKAATARICLFAIAFLAMRTAGAHAHLCFDGNEPPASVHVGDFDTHHQSDNQGPKHSDRDVNLIGDTLAKKSDNDGAFDLPVLVRAALAIPAPIKTTLPRLRSLPAGTVSVPHMRPPLRAPPL